MTTAIARDLTFLFWNLHQRPLANRIATLALSNGVQVLVLAECTEPVDSLLDALNQSSPDYSYVSPFGPSARIQLFVRFAPRFIVQRSDIGRSVFFEVALPTFKRFLVGAVHLPSKLELDDSTIRRSARQALEELERLEAEAGSRRSLVIGDFNLDPFDDGLVNCDHFHSVMDRKLAKPNGRKVQGQRHAMFYNPMWNLFGDNSGPPGTYFRPAKAQARACFWHMYDQVLIRPDLVPNFISESLAILDSDGVRPLIDRRGRPEPSDHLPIHFRLALEQESNDV